jgi:hypothetical protein
MGPSVAPAELQMPAPPVPATNLLPSFELVRERSEEPRPDSPITYREQAFAVAPGVTRSQVEALLNDRYRATLAAIVDRPPGKFVQLAVFDHVFKRRPERPPLATFAWKDWRGAPIMAFPGFGEEPMAPMSQVPPAPMASGLPPANGVHASVSALPSDAANLSLSPLPVPLVPASATSAPTMSTSLEVPSVVPSSSPPSGSLLPSPMVRLEPVPTSGLTNVHVAPVPVAVAVVAETASAVAEPLPIVVEAMTVAGAVLQVGAASGAAPLTDVTAAPVVTEPAAQNLESAAGNVESSVVVSGPVVARTNEVVLASEAAAVAAPLTSALKPAPDFDIDFESTPFSAAPSAEMKSAPGHERVSRPRQGIIGRRRAGEDLISELFEYMHELHFQRDVATGADFVLSVLDEVLPCEGVLIHVFDINTGHFVVVRAKGPNATAVLLQRMSDQDPFALSVMRSPRSISVPNAASDARFNGPRWRAVGVSPKSALCGGVSQGGRYLGLIELVNPQGGTPFHFSELNALDYICEQFADFLSKKPLVLAPDVVLARV